MEAGRSGPVFSERCYDTSLRAGVELRVLPGERPEQRIHIEGDPIASERWLRARDRLEKSGAPALDNAPVDAQRNPKARAPRKFNSRSHYTNHGTALPVETDQASD